MIGAPRQEAANANDAVAGPTGSLIFIAVTPCRLVETRAGNDFPGAFGPPSLQASRPRTIPVPSSGCGIPAAAAYSVNFAVVPPAGGSVGYLSAWPDDQIWPGTVVLNDYQGGIVSESGIVPAGADGGFQVLATNPTDLVIDINGYFLSRSSINFRGAWNSTTA